MYPSELIRLDRAHVWHPYASIPAPQAPLIVDSASGVHLRLRDATGAVREVVDGMSSWWAVIHGYAHPALDRAITEQVGRMSHVMFGGLTHEPAVRLAKRLVDLTPDPLRHVFFSDSGSVSVEVAIKMCLQYWRAMNRPHKRRLITWRSGYYGDTFHPMSVCDPAGGMHHAWTDILPRQIFADAPPIGYDSPLDSTYLRHLTEVIAAHADEVAAVIVEPVVQGAGGMRFHNPGYVRAIYDACRAHDVLLIFDEIATGFGRTGRMFAADYAEVAPDVMCVGKALTGGYLSMAATLCTSTIAEGISRGDPPVLAHGPTFMGNPLACSVANASLDLLATDEWVSDVKRIEIAFHNGLTHARKIPGVISVRYIGAIAVIQLDHHVDIAAATTATLAEGVWLRPFRDLIYSMPPYIADDDNVRQIATAMIAAARIG